MQSSLIVNLLMVLFIDK